MAHDIIIIGAGPAGLSFARSLKDTGLHVAMIEKSSLESIANPAPDGREIALTHLSRKLMTALGSWDRLPADDVSPIKTAKVLNGDSSYSLVFDNQEPKLEALGYLVPNYLIRKAAYEETATVDNVDIITDTAVSDISASGKTITVTLANGEKLQTPLAVAADSRFSETRRKMGIPSHIRDFSRTAIVCRMEHEFAHDSTAYECFFYGRTMALLPMHGNHSSVVITVPTALANPLMEMPDDEFSLDVQRHFGDRFGRMKLSGERFAYPLVAVHADRFFANRFAVIGDAAVGMHPVTAHGFNLGLQGQEILAQEIKQALAHSGDYGAAELLSRYSHKHRQATSVMYHGTNGIVGLFTNESMPAKFLRDAVLRVANNLPPLKHLITNRLTEVSGGAGHLLPF